MKITVLNGSPRSNGNTSIMAEEFKKGAEAVGHTVTVLDVAKLKINGCLACQHCMSHKGVCAQSDDMQKVYASLNDSEMVVFASPIYFLEITSQLKAVVDRTYAYMSTGFPIKKSAMLLDAGNPSKSIFDAAVFWYNQFTASMKLEDKGIVLANGMLEKGSIKDSDALKEVYKLANSL